MLNVDIRDNHLCLGIRIDEVFDGFPFGPLRESVIIEPIKANKDTMTFKIMTIRYDKNAGYRGPDLEVTFKYKEQWTSRKKYRYKLKETYEGMEEYNKHRRL